MFRRDQGGLGVTFDQIKFDPVRAKLSTAIGACLRRIARKVEGFKINIRISRNLLPFDIFLNMGTTSARLFGTGNIDEFFFFQRTGISDDLEVEYVTRLEEADAGTEDYKAYVLFKPRGESLELVDLQKEDELWKRWPRPAGPSSGC